MLLMVDTMAVIFWDWSVELAHQGAGIFPSATTILSEVETTVVNISSFDGGGFGCDRCFICHLGHMLYGLIFTDLRGDIGGKLDDLDHFAMAALHSVVGCLQPDFMAFFIKSLKAP